MITEPATAGRSLLTLRNSLLFDSRVLTSVNGFVFVVGASVLDDALGPCGVPCSEP
jgi:hypothetical protein